MNDHDEDKLGLVNNNPSGDEEPYDNDPVNDGPPLTVLSTLNESDKESNKSTGVDNVDEASSTALSQTVDGNDATTTSPTALDQLVDGSDAPPASATALDLSCERCNEGMRSRGRWRCWQR